MPKYRILETKAPWTQYTPQVQYWWAPVWLDLSNSTTEIKYAQNSCDSFSTKLTKPVIHSYTPKEYKPPYE